MSNFYQTRDLVARHRMHYDGAELQPGDRFKPMSQVDADYLVSRQRADLADAAATPAAPAADDDTLPFWPNVPAAAHTPPPAPARRVVRRRVPEAQPAAPAAALTDDTANPDTSAPD